MTAITMNRSDVGHVSVLKPAIVIQTDMKATFFIEFSPKVVLDKSALFALLSLCYFFLCLSISLCLSFCGWWGQRILFHTLIHKSQLVEGLQKY